MKNKNHNIIILCTMFFLGSCSDSNDSFGPSESSSAISGSYARMLAVNDRLYVIDETDIYTLDITDPEIPSQLNSFNIGEDIETIFYNGTYLFIGSQNGLYIYSLNNNGVPVFQSLTNYEDFGEVQPCDPVVANQTHAFVTLSTSGNIDDGNCSRFIQLNQLRIYDVSDVNMVNQLSSVEMSNPKGLALDDNILFVCEANDGLKVFDVSEVESPVLLQHFPAFEAFDAIAFDGLLMVVGPQEIKQYDYTDLNNIVLLSSIEK